MTNTANSITTQCFPFAEISRIAERESWRKEVNRPIYHIHKWWATRLGSVFRAITLFLLDDGKKSTWDTFYDLHDFNDRIIFDPFMGSGTTLGEAIKLGVKVIGCDINPISTFLVRQSLSYVPLKEIQLAYAEIEKKVKQRISHYYVTSSRKTNEKIDVIYYFWVKTVETPGGEVIPLFDRYVFSQNAYPKRKPQAQIICAECWNIIEDRYDSTHVDCPYCGHSFNPQKGRVSGAHVYDKNGEKYKIKDLLPNGQPPVHKMYAILGLEKSGEKVYLSVQDEDLELFTQAQTRLHIEELPLPTMHIRDGHNTAQVKSYNYSHWKEFFNDRQLLCPGLLLKAIMEIDNIPVQEQLLCLFSSTLEFNNMFCSFKGEGTGAVRHMFHNHILKPERTPLENSIWGTPKSSGCFSTLFKSRLIKAKEYLDSPFEVSLTSNGNGQVKAEKIVASPPIRVTVTDDWSNFINNKNAALVLNGNSASLPIIPNESVDAVITDPPYFDFIHYSELSDFFYAWLAPVLQDRYSCFNKPDSSDINEVQHKSPETFSQLLGNVFRECYRVTKANGTLTFSFHHSKPDGWVAIYQALSQASFKINAVYPVHAEMRTSAIKSSSKQPISLDILLICTKSNYAGRAYNWGKSAFQMIGDLVNENIPLTQADKFLIHTANYLVEASEQKIEASTVEAEIVKIYNRCFSE